MNISGVKLEEHFFYISPAAIDQKNSELFTFVKKA